MRSCFRFAAALRGQSGPLARTSLAIATGAVQGFSSAAVAACAHRLLCRSPAAAPATAEAASAALPRASSSLVPALRHMNAALARSLIDRMRDRPAGTASESALCDASKSAVEHRARRPDANKMTETALRAWRNCKELGQGRLAIELYDVFRAAALRGSAAPLGAANAADVVRWLGETAGLSSSSSSSSQAPSRATGVRRQAVVVDVPPRALLHAAILVAIDTAPCSGNEQLAADGLSRLGDVFDDLQAAAAVAAPQVVDALVVACARCGALDEALELHARTLDSACSPPRPHALAVLIDRLCEAGRSVEGAHLWHEHAREQVRLPSRTLVNLLHSEACTTDALGADQAHALAVDLGGAARALAAEGCAADVALIRSHGK